VALLVSKGGTARADNAAMSTGVAATTARQDGPGNGDVSPVGGEVGIFQYCYKKYLSMQYD
jgi:hypothetical protein